VGANEGDNSIGRELFQLDLAAQPFKYNRSTANRLGLSERAWSWHDIAIYATIL
jgi:hypothetical protein